MKDLLGTLRCDGHLFRLEEDVARNHQEETCELALAVDGLTLTLDLADLRRLRQILVEGERRLELRQDQAALRRNFSLDLD